MTKGVGGQFDRAASKPLFEFQSDAEHRSRMEKAFLGNVCIPGSAYNIQMHLDMEWVFTIKVTLLGGNTCLLEEREVGFIEYFIREGETWWKSWFSKVKKWDAGAIDVGRDAWLRIYGIPAHVWKLEFVVALARKWGRFICLDDHTAKGEAFDVARIMINTPISLVIPDFVLVVIDGS